MFFLVVKMAVSLANMIKVPLWSNFRYMFFTFFYTIVPGHLAKFQSIANYKTHVFCTFISVNLRSPSLFFLVPIFGWKLEKMTSYYQKYRKDWNYNKNKCGKLHEYRGKFFLFFFVRIAVLYVISKFSAQTIAFLAFWLAKNLRLWANSPSFTSYGK